MGEPSDRELVILARQGDKEAFRLLIERYRTLAERVALRMVGTADTAQDLAQEAVLQAYLSLGDLQKADSFRSWLYGIVWIGPFEGEAIALGLRAYPVMRPQTFDFIVHLLNAFGAHLEEVRVEVLKDNIFYGTAKLRLGEMVKEVDARPSDVLALAVRIGSPIYVADQIMQQTSVGREALEKDYGAIHSGQGVGEILKDREEALKAIQLKLKAAAEKKADETKK